MIKNRALTLVVMLMLGSMLGCSGLINRTYVRATKEETLLRAGFQPTLLTEEQEIKLRGLPSGKMSSLQRHGIIYYLYPDLDHHRLLIGGEEAFARYHQLLTKQLVPVIESSSHLEEDWIASGIWKN